MVNKEKQLAAFPWIELIPFGLYAIVALYVTTPTNVFYQKGLQGELLVQKLFASYNQLF